MEKNSKTKQKSALRKIHPEPLKPFLKMAFPFRSKDKPAFERRSSNDGGKWDVLTQEPSGEMPGFACGVLGGSEDAFPPKRCVPV